MKQVMNVEFLNDDTVKITYGGKDSTDSKEHLLNSFKNDIVKKGYVVENDIQRQDVGDFIYYQFYYFDGTSSRNVWLQVPKADMNSIRSIDQTISEIEKENELPDILFEDEQEEPFF